MASAGQRHPEFCGSTAEGARSRQPTSSAATAGRSGNPSRSAIERLREADHQSERVDRPKRIRKAVFTSAGPIDRGLLARILHQNQFRIVFVVQWQQQAINRANASKSYQISELDETGYTFASATVQNVRALHGQHHREQVIREMSTADIVVCSSPEHEFMSISEELTDAIYMRTTNKSGPRHNLGPLVVITCHETGLLASTLSQLVNSHYSTNPTPPGDDIIIFLDSTHGMMEIPDQKSNSLDVSVEGCGHWYIKDFPPSLLTAPTTSARLVSNIQFYTKRNQYIIKTGSVMAAYWAWETGLRFVHEAILVPGIQALVRRALSEAADALVRYAANDPEVLQNRGGYIDSFIRRLRNPKLRGYVCDVGCNPIQMLHVEKLFFEPACYLAKPSGGKRLDDYRGLLCGMEMALRFRNVPNDTGSQMLHLLLRDKSPEHIFQVIFRTLYRTSPIRDQFEKIVLKIKEEIVAEECFSTTREREELVSTMQQYTALPGCDPSRVRDSSAMTTLNALGAEIGRGAAHPKRVAEDKRRDIATRSRGCDAPTQRHLPSSSSSSSSPKARETGGREAQKPGAAPEFENNPTFEITHPSYRLLTNAQSDPLPSRPSGVDRNQSGAQGKGGLSGLGNVARTEIFNRDLQIPSADTRTTQRRPRPFLVVGRNQRAPQGGGSSSARARNNNDIIQANTRPASSRSRGEAKTAVV